MEDHMKMHHWLMTGFVLVLLLPSVTSAQYLPPGQADFYNTYGVRIGQDLTSVPVGGSLTGVVEDPSALIKHGFTGAKKGDKLMLLNLGQGQWKLKLMSTGTEKPFHLKK
jgi:hypothetical protein